MFIGASRCLARDLSLICKHSPLAATNTIKKLIRVKTSDVRFSCLGASISARLSARKMSSASDLLQVTACDVNDIKDGEMREVDFGEAGKALLVRENGQFSAIGNKCTHHAAPLIKGHLCNGRIRCPWHGACFNAKTGDIEDFPGLDSVQKFEVVIEDEKVVVKARKSCLENYKRQNEMVQHKDDKAYGVVIVGGGAAAMTCAESLRQQAFTGKITILTRDCHPPYNRTKLSKDLLVKAGDIYLRDGDFLKKYGIDVLCGNEVTKVVPSSKSVTLANGNTVSYDQLLLAPGANPRTLPIPGWELENVYVLRTPEDANTIAEKARGKHVLVIGASFIGMEAASSLVGKAEPASVTVCEFFAAPFQTAMGVEVGKVMQSLHEERGVKFCMNASVVELRGDGGAVKQAVLKDGTVLQADVVVAGVGVVPGTGFLQGSGIEMDKRGFVPVDKYLRTNIPDVYAAGDIAVFPLKMRDWSPCNVQHWQMAHFHGNVVGKNMVAENSTVVDSVPFFWTNIGPGKNVRYTGYGMGYDDIVIKGSLEERKFCAYYCKGEEVLAVATYMSDPRASEVAEIWYNGGKLVKSDLV